MVTADAHAATERARGNRIAFVSPALTALPAGQLGFHQGLPVRDPDGHVVELIET